jgi:hypothetical protein
MRMGSLVVKRPVAQQMEKAPRRKFMLVNAFGKIKRVLPTIVSLVFTTQLKI